jgi:hypothetical protein
MLIRNSWYSMTILYIDDDVTRFDGTNYHMWKQIIIFLKETQTNFHTGINKMFLLSQPDGISHSFIGQSSTFRASQSVHREPGVNLQ